MKSTKNSKQPVSPVNSQIVCMNSFCPKSDTNLNATIDKRDGTSRLAIVDSQEV